MNEPVSWPRSRHIPGGGDALVFFEICGDFPAIPAVSRSKYLSNGVPDGVEAHLAANDFARYGDGPMLELLRASNPEAARKIEAAPHVLTLRGTVSDPPNLDYLRDCLGVIAALLDAGGVGVIEPQVFQLYSPSQWRELFWSGGFEPTSHAVILLSPEESGTLWLHTRGMRIYGRPDLSCRGVKPEDVEKLQPVFNGLMRMQAAGALIADNQPVQAVGIEKRLLCRHGGSFEDDNFNNLHLELEWEDSMNEVPI